MELLEDCKMWAAPDTISFNAANTACQRGGQHTTGECCCSSAHTLSTFMSSVAIELHDPSDSMGGKGKLPGKLRTKGGEEDIGSMEC